ncbi:MAG: MBL fold metallo-hydrolase [Planctomycetota bacterium]|nr:MBL fold metallo-hydrolase [Planctomycetota bacterium]
MKIRIWGARGSIPTPSTTDFVTSRYGGNTTCVSVEIPGRMVILDGGSGLRNLGLALVERGVPVKADFFFSHVHWDHIQGFPFFVPSFMKGNEFTLHGAVHERETGVVGSVLENALRGQQRSLNFPIQLADMGAKLVFEEVGAGATVKLAGISSHLTIRTVELNHPGGCFGFRIEEHGTAGESGSFVFATDTEHFAEVNPKLQDLARDGDVLLYDAQYTEDEYDGKKGMLRKGWGHSTWRHGLREAAKAKCKRLLLTHHDPMHDDWTIARIESDARREGAKIGVAVAAAYEGLEFEL